MRYLFIILLACCVLGCVVCQITYIDIRHIHNTQRHKTSLYRLPAPSLVLRRGQAVDFVVHLDSYFNRTNDKIRLEFNFGNNFEESSQLKLNEGSIVYVPLETNAVKLDNSSWRAQVTNVDNFRIFGEVYIPLDAAIGPWRLRFTVKSITTKFLYTYHVHDILYILFNAWNPKDPVYLSNEEARKEYLLNDIGMIYIGTISRQAGRTWTYAQFHESVLPSSFHLLDKSRLTFKERSDVVKVSRAVSAIVNSHDEGGLLVGNWSGSYGDGMAPWQWSNSAVIFRQYQRSGYRPVKFAQCWVFGGITTTILRTLGIPARTITNFASAHDTDESLTVDKFFSGGSELRGVNGDSVWNFHVWSDAWMARRDLPPGYGGWQAIDATPQEKSGGMYQLGPASLEAIKQGKVDYAYDVRFVYSEVNADLVHWNFDGRARFKWYRSQVYTGKSGRKMLTKSIGSNQPETITYQYKYLEGTSEERRARNEAAKAAGLEPILVNA